MFKNKLKIFFKLKLSFTRNNFELNKITTERTIAIFVNFRNDLNEHTIIDSRNRFSIVHKHYLDSERLIPSNIKIIPAKNLYFN